MIEKIWNDTDGGVITTELVLVASVTTATLLAGLTALRTKVDAEFQHLAATVQSVGQTSLGQMKTAEANSKLPAESSEAVGTDSGVHIAGEIDTFVMPAEIERR